VLARLLLPAEFGLIGMITVFTSFASMFVDMGFGSAIVQRKQVEPRHLDTMLWMSMAFGALMAAILAISAPLISQFYQQPLLIPMVRVAAINLLIIPFGMVPAALLQKSMQFNQLARIEIVTTLFSGALCVALALSGWGVWSLLAQGMAVNLSSAVLKWRASGWIPKSRFERHAFRDLWGYSINLFGFNFINYWARNGDNLIVGRILGSAALGIYSRAYSLMLLPINQIIGVVASVMFPALSSIQEDKPRTKRIYLEAMSQLSFIIFPLMIGLSVTAAPFILTVYGEKWAEVIPILQILSIVGLLQSMMNPVGWLYTSQGQTRVFFWWGVFGAGLLIAAILIGAALGSLASLSTCYAIANVILFYPAIAIPGRFIHMTFRDFVRAIYRQLIAATAMGVVVWGVVKALSSVWSSSAVLAGAAACGVVIYVILAFVLRIPPLFRATAWLRSTFIRNRSPLEHK